MRINDKHQYEKPSSEELRLLVEDWVSASTAFLVGQGYDERRILHDFCSWANVVDYVERRRVYYHVFHEGMKMSQSKEVALYAYWILKFSPISIDNRGLLEESKPSSYANVLFAANFFYNALAGLAEKDGATLTNSEKLRDRILRDFQVVDIDKSAMILLAESFLINCTQPH